MRPEYFWEYVQLGNCGSPIEIDEGWLVLPTAWQWCALIASAPACSTRTTPPVVLARTRRPLIVPSVSERGGYVPNVVYSCGALVRGRDILLPFAIGDRFTTFATGSVDSVLAAMVEVS